MHQLYKLCFSSSLLAFIFAMPLLSSAQTSSSSTEKFFETAGRSQFLLSFNHSPSTGTRETYIRKGYLVQAGFIKPFYTEYDDDFARVYSFVAEAGYGRSNTDGPLQDIDHAKDPVGLAVRNSLNPQYVNGISKTVFYNVGVGLRQDLHFSRFNIGLAANTGYARVERPAYRLQDNNLTFLTTGDKVVYAKAEAGAEASGLYFKPVIDLGYRVGQHLVVFASAGYTFGPSFKDATQTHLIAASTDSDAYLNAGEIRAGSLMEKPLSVRANMFTAGAGIRVYFKR